MKVLRSKEKIDQKMESLWKNGKEGSQRWGFGERKPEDWSRAGRAERRRDPRMRAKDCGRLWRKGDGY